MSGDRFGRACVNDGETEPPIVVKFIFHDCHLVGAKQRPYIPQSTQCLIPRMEAPGEAE